MKNLEGGGKKGRRERLRRNKEGIRVKYSASRQESNFWNSLNHIVKRPYHPKSLLFAFEWSGL